MGTRMAPSYANIFMKYIEMQMIRDLTKETISMAKIY